MKSVKELLNTQLDEAITRTSPTTSVTKNPNVPSVIILRRKAIRQFPDNQKVVLYYSDALNQYVTVPFGPDGNAQGMSLSEEEQIDEALPLVPLALQGARSALTSTAGRTVITGAAQLAQRGASMAGRGLKSIGDRALKAWRGSKGAKGMKGKPKTTTASSRQGAPKRVLRRKGVGGKLAGLAAVATGVAGAALSTDTSKISGFGATEYRETKYKVNPNISHASSESRNRNWDEIEGARTKRVWNTGAYNPRAQQVYESIEEIAKNDKPGSITINENSIEITPRIANKICNCHAMLNTKNKKNFEAMLNESVASLKKIIDFSIRKGK